MSPPLKISDYLFEKVHGQLCVRKIDAGNRPSVDGNADREQILLELTSALRQEEVVLSSIFPASYPAQQSFSLQARQNGGQGCFPYPHTIGKVHLREPFLLPQSAEHSPFRDADAVRQKPVGKCGHESPMGLPDKKTEAAIRQRLRASG